MRKEKLDEIQNDKNINCDIQAQVFIIWKWKLYTPGENDVSLDIPN